ncbi:MAG: hypothetical protein CM15mP58_15600 [Burkholderiaceae bacterium]|nr:MAG: hypothetical protein CM15mP58_15600 [Burkholderiaceae bacterium]
MNSFLDENSKRGSSKWGQYMLTFVYNHSLSLVVISDVFLIEYLRNKFRGRSVMKFAICDP